MFKFISLNHFYDLCLFASTENEIEKDKQDKLKEEGEPEYVASCF